MCGRYTVYTEEEVIEMKIILEEIFNRYKDRPIDIAAYNPCDIRPTNVTPMIGLLGGKPTAGLMQWGMPKWDGKGVHINAKRETAHELRTFKSPLETKRIIIPSTGFYEWDHTGKYKVKYLIRRKDEPMMYFAGIYNTYKDEAGHPYSAYVILTAAANQSIAGIHDRMPVILHTAEEREAWLRDYGAAREILVDKDEEQYILTESA